MKRRCLGSHSWIIHSGCFLFALSLLISIGFSGGTSADEGHEQAGKKSSPTPKRVSGDNDGRDKAPGGHFAKEEAPQDRIGAGGRHGHREVQKRLTTHQEKGFQLISALHCNACHYISSELEHGAGHRGGHAGVAPDLTNLGNKFRPGWLFEFLQNPQIIRPWLKIRMPDFRLTEQEIVALVGKIPREKRASLIISKWLRVVRLRGSFLS